MYNANTAPANVTELPELTIPSISSSAMRVGLSISAPTMRKMDKKATREVISHNNARKGSANVSKKLIMSNAHEDMTRLIAQIRAFHREQTVPWGDLGDRLVSNQNLIDYKNNMAQLEDEFWDLAKRTEDEYPQAVAQARLEVTGLGYMFNEAEYPSVDQLRRKFKFSLVFEAVPDVGDIRVDVGNQAANEMREQYKQVLSDRINAVHQDLMRTCNLNGDAHIAGIQQDLRTTLKGVTPDGLRRDPNLRADTKRKVDAIIKNLPSLGF